MDLEGGRLGLRTLKDCGAAHGTTGWGLFSEA